MTDKKLFGVLPDGVFAWRNVNNDTFHLAYMVGQILGDLDDRSAYCDLDIIWQVVIGDLRPKTHIAFEIWEAGHERSKA